jgi:hypothetical protein
MPANDPIVTACGRRWQRCRDHRDASHAIFVFYLDDLDADTRDSLGIPEGLDTELWEREQYDAVCRALGLPPFNHTAPIPATCDDPSMSDSDVVLEFVERFGWGILDIMFLAEIKE